MLLDLTDPFKFADRERLLEAILNYKINWRDFCIGTDRQGIKFYYPMPKAVEALEQIGSEADRMVAYCSNRLMSVSEAYSCNVSNLVNALQQSAINSFEPFVFGNQTDVDAFRT